MSWHEYSIYTRNSEKWLIQIILNCINTQNLTQTLASCKAQWLFSSEPLITCLLPKSWHENVKNGDTSYHDRLTGPAFLNPVISVDLGVHVQTSSYIFSISDICQSLPWFIHLLLHPVVVCYCIAVTQGTKTSRKINNNNNEKKTLMLNKLSFYDNSRAYKLHWHLQNFNSFW